MSLPIKIVFLLYFFAFNCAVFAQPFTGCPTGNEVIASTQATLEQQFFDLVNQVRKDTFSLPPLIHSTKLDYACRYHLLDMKADGYFCHPTMDPSGTESCQSFTNMNRVCESGERIQSFLGYGTVNDEALGQNFATAAQLVTLWLADPPHRAILANSFSHGGVGVIDNGGGFYNWNLEMVRCGTTINNLAASICLGDSIWVGGTFQKTAGIYGDTIKGSNGCDSIITALTLAVNPFPVNQSISICQGDSILLGGVFQNTAGIYNDTIFGGAVGGCDSVIATTLSVTTVDTLVVQNGNTLSANAASVSYQWIDCSNNLPINGATAQTFIPPLTGNYSVKITQNGCTRQSSCYQVSVGGIIFTTFSFILKIHPNPAENNLRIDFGNKEQQIFISVFDCHGKQIKRQQEKNISSFNIDISDLHPGIYLLRLISDEGKTAVVKVVKN